MWRYYEEHPEFGAFSRFNTDTGELQMLGKDEYQRLSSHGQVFTGDKSVARTHFPRRIYLQISRQCNLACDYCYIKADSRAQHLDTNTAFLLAEYLGSQGLMEVRLTGGEPTLHPSFVSIVEGFRKNHVYVSIATNGMWSPAIKEFLQEQHDAWLIVSIDGREETHNRYRRNSYATIIKNLAELRQKNPAIRLRINTVLGRYNRNDLAHLALLVKELEAESITLIPLRPQVRDARTKDQMLTALEFKDAIREMIDLRKVLGIHFTTTIATEFKGEMMPDKVFTKRSSCAAGREGTNLDFNAKRQKLVAYACSYCPASDPYADPRIRKPFTAGEFGYDDISEFGNLWSNDSKWVLFRDLSLKSFKCRSCIELGTRCTGSCPIQNWDVASLALDGRVKQQIMDQMQRNVDWYCYKDLQ